MKTNHELEEVLSQPLVQTGKLRSWIAHFKDWAVFFLGPGLGKNGAGMGGVGAVSGLTYKVWLDRNWVPVNICYVMHTPSSCKVIQTIVKLGKFPTHEYCR